MAFAFASGEPVDVEARRLAKEGAAQVLAAIANASEHENQRERLIHDARRTLKRLRALVRLVSGDPAHAHLLRDAARPLGAARDAAVMLQTFDAIGGLDPNGARVRSRLLKARKKLQHDVVNEDPARKVEEFVRRVDDWKLDSGWDAIAPGLRRSYRRGRHALEEARGHSDAEVLHELRKRAKDLQYELGLLRNVWRPVVGGYGDAVKELGELLGDDHDLAVLRDELQRIVADPQVWLDKIDGKREKLRKKIFPAAERIYLDSPSKFVDRFAAWWKLSS